MFTERRTRRSSYERQFRGQRLSQLYQHKDILEAGDPALLKDLPLLNLSKDNQVWTTWASWFSAIGVSVEHLEHTSSYNNYVYVLDAAIAGEGMALGLGEVHHTALEQRVVGSRLYDPG